MSDAAEARVRRAERAALLSVGLTMFVIVAASAVLIVQKRSEPTTVSWRAEQFVLLDADGNTRGSWEVGNDGPYLSMVGADGRSRVVVAAVSTGPAVLLYDANDTMRARMALGDEQVDVVGADEVLFC